MEAIIFVSVITFIAAISSTAEDFKAPVAQVSEDGLASWAEYQQQQQKTAS